MPKRIFEVINEDENLLTHLKELTAKNKLGLKYLGGT